MGEFNPPIPAFGGIIQQSPMAQLYVGDFGQPGAFQHCPINSPQQRNCLYGVRRFSETKLPVKGLNKDIVFG
jgi:hypothetical protein